ncbi:hypothetical protein PR048_000939 [Dryococelus australis]|uniref:PiggyBac transposable element-derived protein domain-containing protein n=1 Tax=Dryococelus australis TaxID=614101 RepID=A0ABQ9IFZ5_9NEOP|nr:hypothetical protein PR048_000939 [Dryococelus australis]
MCRGKKPRLSDYGTKKFVLCTPFPSSVMNRDRFKDVLSNLHLNYNNCIARNQPNHDPSFKLRSFLDNLLQAFSASFAPYGNLTVDEGMCGFQGRIHFKCAMLVLGMFCEWKCTQAKVHKEAGVMSALDRLLSDYYGNVFTVFVGRYYSTPKKKTKGLPQNNVLQNEIKKERGCVYEKKPYLVPQVKRHT